MQEIYNFSAEQSMLPSEVLERAERDIIKYRESGMSVLELGAGSEEFDEILASCESLLRKLMNIPSNYRVLFLQGDPSAQYSAIPLNLLSEHKCADYIITGQTADRAFKEAKRYGDIVIAATSSGANPAFSTIPVTGRSDFRPDADYVHICYNNTVYGTKYNYVPDTGNISLVAEMSSYILSEPVDVTKFALIYAGSAQNISIAGMTVVIVREDLLGGASGDVPLTLDYKRLAEKGKYFNTPPCYNVYLAKLTLEWLLEAGGLEEMKRRNERKASLIYDYIDGQTYYTSPVDKQCRSLTNIVFTTSSHELNLRFIEEARSLGLVNIEGDASIGGMRASIYNAMPYAGVSKLVTFMKRFAIENPKLLDF